MDAKRGDVIKPGLVKLQDGNYIDPMRVSGIGVGGSAQKIYVFIHQHNVSEPICMLSCEDVKSAVKACDSLAAIINEARTAAQ